MKKFSIMLIALFLLPNAFGISSVDTEHTITKVRIGNNSGNKYIVASSYEGTVLGISYDGTILWQNKLSGYMNHDLWCEDITGDGKDEIFAANADGNIYCINSDGTLHWQFKHSEAPMNAVTVVDNGTTQYVVCGGYDLSIFYLTTAGKLHKEIPSSKFSIDSPWGSEPRPEKNRSSTNFLRPINKSDGTQQLAMLGTCNSLQVTGTIYIFDILSETTDITVSAESGDPIGEMRIVDIDKDGNEELLLGTTGMINKASVVLFDPASETHTSKGISGISNMDNFGYRVAQPIVIPGGTSTQYLVLFGSRIILFDNNFSSPEVLVNNYSYNDLWYNASNNTVVLASAQSGGSCVHIIDLNDANWKTQYKNLEPTGKLAKILSNTENYRNKLTSFTKPLWEKDQELVYWTDNDFDGTANSIMNEVKSYSNTPVFLGYYWGSQVQDPDDWNRNSLENATYRDRRDGRQNYSLTEGQILSNVTPNIANEGIAMWGGHGNDPYYYSLQTIKKIIDLAQGKHTFLIYPELEAHDSDFKWVLDNHFCPMAEYAELNNTRLFVRTKNIFWQSIAHMPLWDRMLSGEFSNVFVPGMEETTSKIMDVSVPGRVGYWMSGAVDNWGTRTARDNASYDRLRQFSHQMVPNHFLRQYVYNISLGATYINNFNYNSDYISFIWELIAKGAIYIPRRNEILSISPMHISIIDVDKHYLDEGTSNKWTTFFNADTEKANPMVWSRLNGTWPGAPVNDWDYSNYASGIKERRLDFLPPNPYGLLMVTPTQNGPLADIDAPRGKMVDKMHPFYKKNMKEFYTDGKSYYSADGTQVFQPDEYYSTVKREIENRANYLPITVTGEVAWVVAQTAEKHLRLTLIDGGYINPSDKIATVTFNTVEPIKIIDLVDGKEYNNSGNSVEIDIPCGLFRFIDIEIKEAIDTNVVIPGSDTGLSENQLKKRTKISHYPNPVYDELVFDSIEELASASIFDVNGRAVKSINSSEIKTGKISMSEIACGVYFVKWTLHDGMVITSSIVKN